MMVVGMTMVICCETETLKFNIGDMESVKKMLETAKKKHRGKGKIFEKKKNSEKVRYTFKIINEIDYLLELIGDQQLVFEDELPEELSDKDYENWYKNSRIIYGVRMGLIDKNKLGSPKDEPRMTGS